MPNNYISWHNSVDRELLNTLNDLVEKYNKYLSQTQKGDQLNIHQELHRIIEKIKNFIPSNMG